MDQETEPFLRLTALLVAVVAVLPALYTWYTARKGHLREEYKHAQQFMEELKGKSQMHQFVKEMGLHALAGNRDVEPQMVLYVLELPSPVRGLRNLVHGRNCLELIEAAEGARLQFKSRFRKRWQRCLYQGWYFALYLVFSLLSLSPLLLIDKLHMNGAQLVQALIASVGICVWPAGFALRASTAIYRAEVLLRS